MQTPTKPLKRLLGLLAAAGVLMAVAAPAASAQSVQLVPFGGQNFDQPYYVAAAPGGEGRVWVVEAPGRIQLVKNGVTLPTPFLDISADVLDGGEGGGCECGLFSIALAPDYAASGRFYAFYTRDADDPGDAHYLRIEEFRRSSANPDVADPATRRTVLEIEHFTASNHNGGQLQFGPDGYLYISVGDGGNTPDLAQSLTTRLGKLLRIDPRGAAPFQYSIPPGNPFADGPGGNADEIYAYGLRNPYRFSFDRGTGDLTIGDVGGGSFEEVDFQREGTGLGRNFGWPCIEGNQVNSTAGACAPPLDAYEPPALTYVNPGAGSAAVSGGYVIRDSALPSLIGRYIYADTYGAVEGLRTALLTPGVSSGDASLGVSTPNPVSFGQDACRHIYVASIAGVVSRLEPTSGPFPCKLGPQPSIDASAGNRAGKLGALLVDVSCDEDCVANATGSITVKRKKRLGKRGRRFQLVPTGAKATLELGAVTRLRLALTKKQARRLRKALAAGRSATANVQALVSGPGGGSRVAAASVKQRR